MAGASSNRNYSQETETRGIQVQAREYKSNVGHRFPQ